MLTKKSPQLRAFFSEGKKHQAMKIAIKANKNINTPPTMGKIIGAACATASIASGVTGVEAPAFCAGWPSIAGDVG